MAEIEIRPLESLRKEDFAPTVGSHFEVPFEDGTSHQLELAEVRDVFVGGNREGKRQAFALTLLGEKKAFLKQGTYLMSHAGLGYLSFFIVPLGPDPQRDGRISYEAIFT